jgi:iron complex outermembrane receptor protein
MRAAMCGLFTIVMFVFLDVAVLAQTSQNGTIVGSVTGRVDGQPVGGAVVTVEGTALSVMTTPIGRFQISAVPVGTITLVVHADGFLDVRVPDVRVQLNSTAEVDIALELTPNILERVQVTATKTPLSIGDTAAQTDVIDRQVIDSRGDQTLTQAITHVPGAVVSTQLGIFESVMLRGLPRGDPEFTNTLLLIDGIPQTTSRNGSRVVGLTINDASNIEVVRGPNSALYGRTAIGGSVNVLTADPTPDRQFGFDFTGGELGMLKGLFSASGPISTWGGYYVSIGKERNTGYYNTKTGGDFVDGNTAGFAKLTFVPDAKSFGSISFNRVVSENSTPTNEPIINGQLLHILDPRFDRLTNFNIPGPNYNQNENRLTVHYERQLSTWARFVDLFGYRTVLQQFVEDGDFIGSPFDLATQTIEQYPFNQTLDEDIVYEEARVELTPQIGGKRNSLILGGSYERDSGSLATDFIYTDPVNEGFPMNYLNPVLPPRSDWQHDVQPNRVYHVGITGLFAQYLVEPHPRWVVMAGGRYDRLALDNTPEGSPVLTDTFSAFSPKASVTYKLLNPKSSSPSTLNVYGAYSHAFLPPRAPSSLTPPDVTLHLQPEDINNVEGGLKGSLMNGRVSFEGTYFWMVEDGVVLTQRQGPFFFPTNAGQQRYRGFETGVTMAVTPQVSVFANAAFYHNRFGEFVIQSADGDEVLTGNRLPVSPDTVFSAGLSFTPIPAVDATINVKHMGAVMADQENTFQIDPYTLVDAAVTWRRGLLRITLSAHNLFNTTYYWNADGETADPGRPRQVLITTSVRIK